MERSLDSFYFARLIRHKLFGYKFGVAIHSSAFSPTQWLRMKTKRRNEQCDVDWIKHFHVGVVTRGNFAWLWSEFNCAFSTFHRILYTFVPVCSSSFLLLSFTLLSSPLLENTRLWFEARDINFHYILRAFGIFGFSAFMALDYAI